jgi:hypothetical protein
VAPTAPWSSEGEQRSKYGHGTERSQRESGCDVAEGDHGAQRVRDRLRYPVHGNNRTGPRGFSNSMGSM